MRIVSARNKRIAPRKTHHRDALLKVELSAIVPVKLFESNLLITWVDERTGGRGTTNQLTKLSGLIVRSTIAEEYQKIGSCQ